MRAAGLYMISEMTNPVLREEGPRDSAGSPPTCASKVRLEAGMEMARKIQRRVVKSEGIKNKRHSSKIGCKQSKLCLTLRSESTYLSLAERIWRSETLRHEPLNQSANKVAGLALRGHALAARAHPPELTSHGACQLLITVSSFPLFAYVESALDLCRFVGICD